jgi:hypothetical protein
LYTIARTSGYSGTKDKVRFEKNEWVTSLFTNNIENIQKVELYVGGQCVETLMPEWIRALQELRGLSPFEIPFGWLRNGGCATGFHEVFANIYVKDKSIFMKYDFAINTGFKGFSQMTKTLIYDTAMEYESISANCCKYRVDSPTDLCGILTNYPLKRITVHGYDVPSPVPRRLCNDTLFLYDFGFLPPEDTKRNQIGGDTVCVYPENFGSDDIDKQKFMLGKVRWNIRRYVSGMWATSFI